MKRGRRLARKKKATPKTEVKELSDKDFEIFALINILLKFKKIEEDFKNLTKII